MQKSIFCISSYFFIISSGSVPCLYLSALSPVNEHVINDSTKIKPSHAAVIRREGLLSSMFDVFRYRFNISEA